MRVLIAERANELGSLRGGVLVPTMGALHAGHAGLVSLAAGLGRGPVVVSVFVDEQVVDHYFQNVVHASKNLPAFYAKNGVISLAQ